MHVTDVDFSKLSNVEYEYLFKTVISTHEYVFFKDAQGRFLYVNDALLSAFSETKLEDVIGKSDYDYYPKEFADSTYEDEQKVIHENSILLDKEERLLQPNGKKTWYKVSKYPLLNTNGKIIGVWGMSSNIDSQKEIEHQLEQANKKLLESKNAYRAKSEVDQTTGLKNKSKMYKDLKSNMRSFEKSRRQEDTFCVAFLDLDDFKQVNDNYGHSTGDFVLKQTAILFESAVRAKDTVYRFGGDEFVICYMGIGPELCKITTERMINIINSHIFNIEDYEIKSSVSAGIASCDETKNINELVKLADSRLYKAKSSGKNTVV